MVSSAFPANSQHTLEIEPFLEVIAGYAEPKVAVVARFLSQVHETLREGRYETDRQPTVRPTHNVCDTWLEPG